MTRADRAIAAIATGQLGAFTRRQANDAGLSDRQLRSRVQSGFLVQPGPHAFRVAGAPTSAATQLHDLLLDIGGEAWVCGATAAALHGIEGYTLRRPFHVLVPRRRNVRRLGAVFHQSEHMTLVDRCRVGGAFVTSGARTLIDVARVTSPERLLSAVESTLLLGIVSEDLLYRRIGALRSKGRFGMPALLTVLDERQLASGAESWLESEYLRLLRRAGLPLPDTQQVLTRARDRTVRVDCRFPGTSLVVELLGYRYHRSRGDLNRDAARSNALMSAGYSPYQFTFDNIVNDPTEVVETTARALVSVLRAA